MNESNTLHNFHKAQVLDTECRDRLDSEESTGRIQVYQSSTETENLQGNKDESDTHHGIHKAYFPIAKDWNAIDDEVEGVDDIDDELHDFSAFAAKAGRGVAELLVYPIFQGWITYYMQAWWTKSKYLNPSSGIIYLLERYLNPSSGIINPQEGYLNPSSEIINPQEGIWIPPVEL